jgi:AcrR family transcriptional regulator
VTREQVVDVAYGLVGEEGPTGLSMRKLASALHVSLPTVYTAIDSREVLVDELQDRIVDELADTLELEGGSPAAPDPDGEELEGRGRALLEWSKRRPGMVQFILDERIRLALAERTVRRAPAPRRAAASSLLRTILGAEPGDRLDAVTAVAVVIAEARAALWLASQERAEDRTANGSGHLPGGEVWLSLACDHVAHALRVLAGSPVRAH